MIWSMIKRPVETAEIRNALKHYPVVAILGARQVGKTTLARQLAAEWRRSVTMLDLEDPADVALLADPMLYLRDQHGLVILDEIQRFENLFPALRVLADRPRTPARFLILGNASPSLLRQSSESLAGRIHYHELRGLSLRDVTPAASQKLWLRGGFPRSFTAASEKASYQWREDFIKTFLERDLHQLGVNVASTTMYRFWSMLANYHAQIWNAAEFARAFGMSESAVRGYLDKLTAALVVRQLRPWHENLTKRQVKAPKVYLSDTGVLHTLLGQRSRDDLLRHPKVGASWEGFVIEQICQAMRLESGDVHFWATHAGAELDLLIVRGRRRIGVEIKRTSTPQVTPSMRIAMQDLKLTAMYVVHAGPQSFGLPDGIRAVAFNHLLDEFGPP